LTDKTSVWEYNASTLLIVVVGRWVTRHLSIKRTIILL